MADITAGQIVATFIGDISNNSTLISNIASMPSSSYRYYNLTITDNTGTIQTGSIISSFGSGQITMNKAAQSTRTSVNFNIVTPAITRKDQDFEKVARSGITNKTIGWD